MRLFRILLLVMVISMFGVMSALAQAPDLQEILENYVNQDEPGAVLLVSSPAGMWGEARGLAD